MPRDRMSIMMSEKTFRSLKVKSCSSIKRDQTHGVMQQSVAKNSGQIFAQPKAL